MSPQPEPDPLLGTVYGHCRLERKLGEGGMGRVYLATHTTLNKLVAVKVLRSDLNVDPHAADRFLREARAAARVEHPSVVQCYDIGQADGTFYIVMQYVEGTTLDGLLKKQGALGFVEAVRIIRAVCEGVREAHQHGIIHRDIKPDNILLGRDGSVKLADFGLARAAEGDPNLSQTGRVFGTPHFMSPEQALGEKVDHRSDIYSLGATFYRAVTGRYPFQATTAMGVVFKLTHETPPPARDVNPAIPANASDLISEMMARKPSDRVQSVEEVLIRLDSLLPSAGGGGPSSGPDRRPGGASRTRAIPITAPILRPLPRRSHKKGLFVATAAVAALAAASCLVLQRYGVINIAWLSPADASGSPAPHPGTAGPADTVAAAKEAASLAAGEETPNGLNGSQAKPAERPPQPPPAERPRENVTEAERKALEKRANELAKDIDGEPERLLRYLDPQSRSLKSALALRRFFMGLKDERPPGGGPFPVSEVVVDSDGRSGQVTLRGVTRPITLRWLKRRTEWFLSPPLRRTDEKKS